MQVLFVRCNAQLDVVFVLGVVLVTNRETTKTRIKSNSASPPILNFDHKRVNYTVETIVQAPDFAPFSHCRYLTRQSGQLR